MSSAQQSPLPRIPLQLDVEYRKSYGRMNEIGQLRNISLSGAFLLHQNETLQVGNKVALTFKVGGRIRKIQAVIIWSNSAGAGVRFMPQNNRDVQIIDDLMYFVENKREGARDVIGDIFKQAA